MPDPYLHLQAMSTAAIAAFLMVAVAGWWYRSVADVKLHKSVIVAFALGFALGASCLRLQPNWPPTSALDRFMTLVLPFAIASELLAGNSRVPRWFVWSWRLVLSAVVVRILLHGSVYLTGTRDAWPLWQVGTTWVVCSGLLLATWGALEWLSQRPAAASLPISLALAIQCAGWVVMLAGYIKGGSACFPFAAALVGAIAATPLIRPGVRWHGVVGIAVVGLFSLLFIGRFFGGISTTCALTIFLAPLLCGVTELPMLRHWTPRSTAIFRLALVSIPLIIVLTLAKRDFDRHMGPLLGALPTWFAGMSFDEMPRDLQPNFTLDVSLIEENLCSHS